MDERVFWTTAVSAWACAAIWAYVIAGGLTPDFIFWAFVIAMLELPLVLASSLLRRRE